MKTDNVKDIKQDTDEKSQPETVEAKQYLMDEETFGLIQQLCDVALKAGGMQNINAVNHILVNVKEKE